MRAMSFGLLASPMRRLSELLGAMSLALLTTLAVAAPAPAGAATTSASETISNVATIEWDQGVTHLVKSSNQVDILVNLQPAELSTYQLVTSGAATTISLAGSSCLAPAGPQQTDFEGPLDGINPDAAPIRPASAIRAGEPLIIEVDRPAANIDPSSPDKLVVVITTPEGDQERLVLIENGPNTGKFFGAIATMPIPPAPEQGDCELSVTPGDAITLSALDAPGDSPFATSTVDVLADPYGIAFDSADGTPVAGTRISIVDADTGAPAQVFGEDGKSAYPSTIVTGTTVTDASGRSYSFPPGDYRFPLMRPGRYRLIIEPPSPYVAPSNVPAERLASLRRPDGTPFAISAASYGGVLVLNSPMPVQVDVPLDKSQTSLLLSKSASVAVAETGDTVQYRVTIGNPSNLQASGPIEVRDLLPDQMRLRLGTVRVDGAALSPTVSGDGHQLVIPVPSIAPSGSSVVTYVLEVRPDARAGDALNKAQVFDSHGSRSNVAGAAVRIQRNSIADRMTVEGRVTEGGCSVDPRTAHGIAGVRIMLEDGSYSVTDEEGRYHFEGLKPGLHVVQLDDLTLPVDRTAVDCANDTRSGGRAFSRFVEGSGGALMRVDFRAEQSAPRQDRQAQAAPRPKPLSDPAAAGAERDWFAGQQPGVAWLFPDEGHNPRAPVVRVAIKHLPTQTVKLFVNGRPVDPIAFDGTNKNGDGTIAVSLWRGVALEKRDTLLSAEVRDAGGALVQTLRRTVHYSTSPMQAELLRDRSVLVADGVTRPVIALRLTDRDGRPVHHGVVGDFEVPAPYYPAVEADAQQARQLAGLERAEPVWRVEGDDGIAYVELEPTTASGSVTLNFNFRDGETQRDQRVEAWLDPGDRPWTIVGLAQGTIGYEKLSGHVEAVKGGHDVVTEGRLALYAKGRILGKWLMTLAYDTDKKEDQTRFGGTIDPSAYYTVYADRSEQRYDAASVRKLYLKLERPQFYALFGDYETGIDEPELARYVRSFNGVKAEYSSKRLSATAFAADAPNTHRRDEIQGNGLSGPYALGARDIMPNSEQVTIEVRDRLRSDRIIEQRTLMRYVDYDIDYVAGTLRFKEPILSRTSDLDPQFIIADYEVEGIASRSTNAGARVSLRTADQKLQVSATGIHDENDQGRTWLGGADVRYRPSVSTEVRAEAAVTDNQQKTGSTTPSGGTAIAWLVEAEHHGPRYDVLAYAREQQAGFGVGQQNASENGTVKFGMDGRFSITPDLSLTGSAWHEDYLASNARRIAGRALLEYHGHSVSARAGITFADDRLDDGTSARSQILQLGVTKKFFDNKLELDAQTELPLGQDASIDFPAQHRLSARYSISKGIQLVGTYEIAHGKNIDARTARLGFDLSPWSGARISAAANVQDIAEYGPRSFAAFGLSQSLVLDKHWSLDFTLDSNKTLHGIDPTKVLNPLHPVASGGFIGSGDTLTEDFTAATAGATYRADLWSFTTRAEYRAGSRDTRYGVTAAALRQIGEGSALGGALSWFTANSKGGAQTRTANLQLSWAHRPAGSSLSWLDKLEAREDSVSGAVAGLPAPIGGQLTVTGDARTRRIMNSLSVNWSPQDVGDLDYLDHSEVSFFWGTRYVTDTYDSEDIKGWSNVVGLDVHFDLSDMVDVGGSASVRQGIGFRSFSYSAGPSIGIKPFDNGWLSIGWNLVGFQDRDFEQARYTRTGPYVTMRFKFDQLSLQGLGLGGH